MHDLQYELNRFCSHDGGNQTLFYPLGELVHYHKDMRESAIGHVEGTHQIKPPSGKGLRDRYGLQLTDWDVRLARKVLATLTMTN
jgi:hypothetical protein